MALVADIKAAMSALVAIHDAEFQALLAGDFDKMADLKVRLQKARKHKAGLIDLYRQHVESHGC